MRGSGIAPDPVSPCAARRTRVRSGGRVDGDPAFQFDDLVATGVESRPVPVARTRGRAGALPFFALPGRPRLGCGESVGTLARLGAAIVIRNTLFLPYAQVRELTRRK